MRFLPGCCLWKKCFYLFIYLAFTQWFLDQKYFTNALLLFKRRSSLFHFFAQSIIKNKQSSGFSGTRHFNVCGLSGIHPPPPLSQPFTPSVTQAPSVVAAENSLSLHLNCFIRMCLPGAGSWGSRRLTPPWLSHSGPEPALLSVGTAGAGGFTGWHNLQ